MTGPTIARKEQKGEEKKPREISNERTGRRVEREGKNKHGQTERETEWEGEREGGAAGHSEYSLLSRWSVASSELSLSSSWQWIFSPFILSIYTYLPTLFLLAAKEENKRRPKGIEERGSPQLISDVNPPFYWVFEWGPRCRFTNGGPPGPRTSDGSNGDA